MGRGKEKEKEKEREDYLDSRMGNCAGSPKTKGDNDALPAPEPAKDELAQVIDEEPRLQPEEKKEDGHDDKHASSLVSLLDEKEKKKEAKENERAIEVPSE